MWRVMVLVAVLTAATVVGFWWRARSGRIAHLPAPAAGALEEDDAPVIDEPAAEAVGADSALAGLGFDPANAHVTLVQFSSAFCQPCRATRAILSDVAAMIPGVAHVDVDAESQLQAVRALDIRRTPTVLFVDSSGHVVKRASGQPRKVDVIAAVASLLPDGSQRETALPDAGTA